jgi:hypothetical protein
MDDIRRQDFNLFLKELTTTSRIFGTVLMGLFVFLMTFKTGLFLSGASILIPILGLALILLVQGATAWSASVEKRFQNKHFQALWSGCQDRLKRFEEVLSKLRREQIADLNEMPITIRKVADSLYLALRRSDMIAHEVSLSEKGLYSGPPVWHAPSHDPQSKELYRIADKNIAEYRQRFEALMAGVQRTEAQSAVYMTTLDTLRMKMLGYRLVGKSPELHSKDFLDALTEAKLQLSAIDTALEELELGPYPKMIAAMPPPLPDEVRQRLNQ